MVWWRLEKRFIIDEKGKHKTDVVDNENTNESGLKLGMSSLMQPIMIMMSCSSNVVRVTCTCLRYARGNLVCMEKADFS